MWVLGPIGFTLPWLLLGLLALPILWILLRAVPPAPVRRRFPGVALLFGLNDEDVQTHRTPWWLLLLRLMGVAAMIVGFAGPVLNPVIKAPSDNPLLIVMDGGWADAVDWTKRIDRVDSMLAEAGRAGRPAAVIRLTNLPSDGIPFQSADVWQTRTAGLLPDPWLPDMMAAADWFAAVESPEFDVQWLSNGLALDGRADVLTELETLGPVTVFETPTPVYGLRPATYAEGEITITALRNRGGAVQLVDLQAIGLDPTGIERVLATVPIVFEEGATNSDVALSLPPELRNRVTRFVLAGQRTAGAISLTDDGLKRREVALIAGADDREGLELLSPLHFLNQALSPTTDLIEGALTDLLQANPDVIILADVATLSVAETSAVQEWVDAGGLLVRFAGPRLAASDVSRDTEDPLMPVRLRAGGRTVGGAMSWGAPKALRRFSQTSPFYGLTIPPDVHVTAQVLAQPDPALADRVIASLEDGTPMVTRKTLGSGQVVLFHVTANAEWSSLPVSGLFVQMLERLSVSTRPSRPVAEDLIGTVWTAQRVLNGFGGFEDASVMAGIPGDTLSTANISVELPPGLYSSEDRSIALNALRDEAVLSPFSWPDHVPVEGLSIVEERELKGALLTAALILLLADVLASLWVSGRLRGPRGGVVATVLVALLLSTTSKGSAQETDAALERLALLATADVVLAHVQTGNSQLDQVAEAGLRGLSDTLYLRTSIEPAEPIAVNLETDELSFFPFLYWPVSVDQPLPSDEAYVKLNRYLRSGGMILFDTRDADVAGYGRQTPEARKLQQLARSLDIPPLELVPTDHVLTRAFYLLQEFPGRYVGREVWVEASPTDAKQVEGMPFRNLNDGVTPVVIGGNDWAAAWAVDPSGTRMFRIGRGYTGELQREISLRFGVNLIMHVLTGNYKSDQVHVPALLDRLGQ
ncbi:MAG: DUF4159 domain-containing protein [Pseudoruegeria sp.]